MAIKNLFQSLRRKPKPIISTIDDQDDDILWGKSGRPIFFRDMPVEVRTESGTSLLLGKLMFFDRHELILERIPGEFSLAVLQKGTAVVICGYNRNLEPVQMKAYVAEPSAISCRFHELVPLNYDKKCLEPRLPLLDTSGKLFRDTNGFLGEAWDCQVLDIGPSGARIVSDWCFQEDLQFRLRVELVKRNGPLSFPARVIRSDLRDDGKFQYGLLFAQLDQRKRNELLREMDMAKQVLQRKMIG